MHGDGCDGVSGDDGGGDDATLRGQSETGI